MIKIKNRRMKTNNSFHYYITFLIYYVTQSSKLRKNLEVFKKCKLFFRLFLPDCQGEGIKKGLCFFIENGQKEIILFTTPFRGVVSEDLYRIDYRVIQYHIIIIERLGTPVT